MPPAIAGQGRHPLRLANFLHSDVIGTSAPATSRSPASLVAALSAQGGLIALAIALVALPVFVQAPLVRLNPWLATVLTAPLLTAALLIERFGGERWRDGGAVLVGFCGSWLAGSLFWGWFRIHPVCHLPIEACLLPLAVAGLGGRWRLAGAFYLASLLGTAATDAGIAAAGLMPLWPQVISAPLSEAPWLLQQAASLVFEPLNLSLLAALALLLMAICLRLWNRGPAARVAAATLAATLAVDSLFLCSSLLAPRLSGLI
jgi:hypothetical protein